MKKITYAKIVNKARRLLSRYIYHNYFYKPTGVYNTSKEYVESVQGAKPTYVEVFPDLVSSLHIPAGLYAAHCAPSPKLTVQTNYVVVEVPQGRVHTDNACSVAIISADNKLIGDVSLSCGNGILPPEQNNIFQQRYFSKPKVVKGVVFSMLSGGTSIVNYGHWMVDTIPRLCLLKKSGLFDKVDYFLVPSIKHDFQRDSLKLLGIPLEKVIEGEKNPHIVADTIIASTAPRGNDSLVTQWAIDFIRDSYLPHNAQANNLPTNIYISRKDSKIRHVVNEDELMAMLSKYNFVSYQLSQLSFIEKVRLFTSANMIVSHTGAGLTNLLFCKPGTKVLEIFSNSYVIGPFYDIAGKNGLDYHYLIGKTVTDNKTGEIGYEDHIVIDINKVQDSLDNMMKEQEPNIAWSA